MVDAVAIMKVKFTGDAHLKLSMEQGFKVLQLEFFFKTLFYYSFNSIFHLLWRIKVTQRQ